MRVARLVALLAPALTVPLLVTGVGYGPARAGSAPSVVITSPADGSFADGTTDVTAVGTADAAAGDRTVSMTLSVDGSSPDALFCPAPASGSCTLTFSLYADGLTAGLHTLTVTLGTDTDAAAASASIVVGAHSPAPSVGLMVPAPQPVYETLGGGYVGGNGMADAWSRTAGLPMSLQLLVDGVPVGTAQSCPVTVVGRSPCSKPLNGRTGAGTHSVQARLTVGSTTLDSPAQTVTVLAPRVAITSPTAGTVVRGTVSVTVVGTVAGPDDKATSLAIASNGAYALTQSTPCDPAASTCTATFQVNARALRSLTAVFTTSHLTVRSAAVEVTPYVDETLSVYGVPAASGHSTTVVGGLGASLGPVPAGTRVTVTLVPAHGKATVVRVPLSSNGSFSLRYRPTTNTTVSATLAAGTAYSAASATSVLKVTPVPQCRLPQRLRRGQLSPLTCTVAYLPKGTRVALQFSAHKHWHTAVSRTSATGKATLPFHWSHAQTLWVRVVISGNHDYAAYVGKPVTIKVT